MEYIFIFIALVWLKRVFWMMRFRKTHPPIEIGSAGSFSPVPKISVIIPARNEGKNIGNCLKNLSQQTYADYEIVCVNDRSEDKTLEIIKNHERCSKIPTRIVSIEKLPAGWTGKNYAMFTGSKAAAGEWFLFTDADTTHKPESLRTAVLFALENKIDFLTLAPETESKTFWEKTVQPLAVSSLALWFQTHKVNDPKNKITLANGQFILVKRSVYEKAGGNEAVKNEVIEDVELAKKIRGLGYHVQFLNGTRLYSTRMYTSLGEIKNGWTRIFTYLFNKKIFPIVHKIFLFLFFSLLPFIVLFAEIALKLEGSERFSIVWFNLSLGVSLWIIAVRFFANRMVRTNPWYAFTHPLGSLVMIWILLCCVGRIAGNRPSVWRGDSYK